MIGTSIGAYVFIRSCIIFLHSIAPVSIAYTLAAFFISPLPWHSYRIVEVWAMLETLFYFLVYLPRKIYLQRAATHPKPVGRERRRILFQRCHDNISDPERYLSRWFMDAPASEIKRENVKDFFRWAFLDTGDTRHEDDEELEEYIGILENLLQRRLEPGRGDAKCLRLTLDKVSMLHRSLFWYMVSYIIRIQPNPVLDLATSR